ncbi:MAG: hypothetical protein E7666_02490 [Ruminococcaceae bacterium]|nr:hypothetical protein [Oscillospiraceae bacterium]
MKDYLYDVFLSFTGADRELKNSIRVRLEEMGLRCYDSDLYCKGHFRDDFCEALDESRVYLMILSDHLRNNPTVSGVGTLTEVRRECSLACELEARNELNIVILCLSDFFAFDQPFHDYHDTVGWFFYTHTRGFSQVRGVVNADGGLSEKTLEEVCSRCGSFVEKRLAGTPEISQAPRLEITTEKLLERDVFKGRECEIETVLAAFAAGKRAVVLSGLGGIGKTVLAGEIARRCEELGFLHCPQTVHIRELGGGESGLGALVSSVSYEKSVYDSLASLSERDKYERKLAVLAALPETVLLIVDNYNALSERALAEILSKLKCRLLITTRARLDRVSESVAVIPIGCLPREQAHEMFCEISAASVDVASFEPLYTLVGGHTITLCIMARMMALHRLSFRELMDSLGELESFDAKVDFRHNEYGDADTVLGHLKKLFDISGFDEGCCRILRSMSLLGNGTVPLDDLMRILGLRNRNEILTLTASGWVELQKKQCDGEIREYLYLHPILSRLVASLLVPTEENTAEMIEYLASSAESLRTRMTYADASDLEDALYYACYVLAGGSRQLSHVLWNRFVEINHLLGSVERTAEKVTALAERIDNDSERSLIAAHADMIVLEQYPTRTDILDKYLGTLESNARDYKWVMRSLSVTLGHIMGIEKYRPFLLRALDKAMDAAIAQKDDAVMLDLCTYYMHASENAKTMYRRAKAYLRMRRREGAANGALLYLEVVLSASSMLSVKNANDYYQKTKNLVSDINEDRYGSIFRSQIFHPILAMRAARFSSLAEQLPDNDPMALSLRLIFGEADRYVTDGQLSAESVIEAAVRLYQARLENQTTLTSAGQAVSGVLQVLRLFPEATVRKSAGELVEHVDMNAISVQSLSNLQVAVLINNQFRNREAIDQARDVVRVLRRLRPEGHHDILAAMIAYGDTCANFGADRAALTAYAEVYEKMKTVGVDSTTYIQLAEKLLGLPAVASYSTSAIGSLLEVALTGKVDTTVEYYSVYWNYARRLLEKMAKKEILYDDPAFEPLWGALKKGGEKRNAMSFVAQSTVIRILDDSTSRLVNQGQFELADALRDFLKPFLRSRRANVRKLAEVYDRFIRFYISYHRRDDDLVARGKAVVHTAIRRRTLQSMATTTLWLMLAHLCAKEKNNPFQYLLSPAAWEESDSTFLGFYLCGIKFEPAEKAENLDLEKRNEIYSAVLCNVLPKTAKALLERNLNISGKEFLKLRSEDAFYKLAIERLSDSLYEAYSNNPIKVNLH